MPDFGRWGGNGGDPSLNAIARTDQYLDALAFENPVYATDPADAELANLMAGWRDEVRRPPARVATQRDAELVLHRAMSSQRRNRMSVAVMGSVAAAMLCLGGFGAVVYGAGPGDALYGMRVALFGEQQVTRDDRVSLAAQTEMQEVQQLIDQGNWDAAQDKLVTVTSTVQTVEDPQQQRDLRQQLNNLTAKVETRDPNATAPPLPDASIVPNASVPSPPGPILLPPLPQLPPSVPGIPLPDISLPQIPPIPQLPLPGPGVPPDISLPELPNLPQLPLPKPPVDLPKPIPGDQPTPSKPPDDAEAARRAAQAARRSAQAADRTAQAHRAAEAGRTAEADRVAEAGRGAQTGRAAQTADSGRHAEPEACACSAAGPGGAGRTGDTGRARTEAAACPSACTGSAAGTADDDHPADSGGEARSWGLKNQLSAIAVGFRRRLVERSVGISAAIIPGHVGIGLRIEGRFVRTHGAVDQ